MELVNDWSEAEETYPPVFSVPAKVSTPVPLTVRFPDRVALPPTLRLDAVVTVPVKFAALEIV